MHDHELKGQMTDPEVIRAYMMAGNAYFTLRSKTTQTRFTFRVSKSKPDSTKSAKTPVWFVSVLTGTDNQDSYTYMGVMDADGKFRFTAKSKVTGQAPSGKAFDWFAKTLTTALVTFGSLPAGLEFWHEGRCGRCGRALTVPESVERGIGPECATKMSGSVLAPTLFDKYDDSQDADPVEAVAAINVNNFLGRDGESF